LQVGSFGERLQREREMRGITLDEIANATKIGTRALRALEEEDFNRLPGGIFNKGFVRAYARYLGIDEEQAVGDYLGASGEEAKLSDEATMRRLEPALRAEKERLAAANDRPTSRSWRPVLVVVLMAALVAAGWNFYSKRRLRLRARTTPPVSVQTSAAVIASVPPVAAPPSNDVAALPAIPASSPTPSSSTNSAAPVSPTVGGLNPDVPAELVVLVRARQKSWVSASADGKAVMKDVLEAGGEKSIRAKQQIVLTAGNAGGLEVSLNGKVLPSLGLADQKKTVIITGEGMRAAPAKTEAAPTEN